MGEEAERQPKLVWLMGFMNSIYGFAYAAVLVTVPQLLASKGVAEPVIANLTALALIVSLAAFAVAPVLDTLVSRRTWSIGLAIAVSALTLLLLLLPPSSALLGLVLATDALVTSLFNAAIGGWLAAVLPKGSDETIGTWFTIGNSFGFGLGAISQFWLISHFPEPLGAAAIAAATLAPLMIVPVVPRSGDDRRRVHESFGNLAGDLVQLIREPVVLRLLLLFVMPCAAFTLTNAFGGIGHDFKASEVLVDVANGIGATVIGFVGSLAARVLLKFLRAPFMYLGTGIIGAAFTLSLLALPHTPMVYLMAVVGENAAQSIAQVSQNAIIFRSIREGSPLASSQFALLNTAAVVPYAYMQMLDGYGYKLAGGVAGSFMMDAFVSLAACLLLSVPVFRWLRAGKLEVDPETSEDRNPGGVEGSLVS